MPDKHARLSPSSSHIWLRCPPSVRLSEQYADETSVYAEEGTEAHSLCEYELRKALGEKVPDPRPNLKHYSSEMQDAADGYTETVLAIREELRAIDECTEVFVEQHVDFSEYVPGGFGTSDAVVIGGNTMAVIDFKYGKGIAVSAEHNPQLMCYALGAYLAFGALYDLETVRLVIYQPRLNNYSTWDLTLEELLSWAESELRPKALLAEAGEGEFSSGEWCRFCRARCSCRARAEKNLELAKYDFEMPPKLNESEIAAILPVIDDLTSWADEIKHYALQQALSGVRYPGFKVVRGRSVRRYSDDAAAAEAVTKAGYDPYEKKILGITAMTQLLGKKKFEEVLGSLITKPPGKPTLVPESDKRPAINTAFEDFKD